MKKVVMVISGWAVLFITGASAPAQTSAPPPGADGVMRSTSDLDQLVGPIALYPDPLIAEILPAATFPSEIVMADRYIGQGGDPNQIAQQPWDPSVQALAHYANVLKWMDDNLPWTTQLGEAFQNQQSDVMTAVQQMRGQAQNLGNLPSTPQEDVVTDDGDIEIEPTDPDEMYVPDYSADQIYYQPGIYCTFGLGLPLGLWLGYDWNWHGHNLVYWGQNRPANWWHQSPGWRNQYVAGHRAPVWHAGGFGPVRNGGLARGFAEQPYRTYARPEVPRGEAPRVEGERPAPVARVYGGEVAPRDVAPREVAPSEREPSFFGGSQSGAETHDWSSRGFSSRATIAPVSRGGGGGGGESRGGGGGGQRR
jgi:hypothetical protein